MTDEHHALTPDSPDDELAPADKTSRGLIPAGVLRARIARRDEALKAAESKNEQLEKRLREMEEAMQRKEPSSAAATVRNEGSLKCKTN